MPVPSDPTILYDFSQGPLAERLPEATLSALIANGLPTRKFWHELSSYLRAKPLPEVAPRRIVEICNRYVNIQPLKYSIMEEKIGRAARELFVHYWYVPSDYWMTLDFLERFDPVLYERMRSFTDLLVETRANPKGFIRVEMKFVQVCDYTAEQITKWGEEVNWTLTGGPSRKGRRPISV